MVEAASERPAQRAIRLLRVTPSLPAIQHRQQESLVLQGSFKPSDGLEPSTPSLPSSQATGGSRWQRNSLVFAV